MMPISYGCIIVLVAILFPKNPFLKYKGKHEKRRLIMGSLGMMVFKATGVMSKRTMAKVNNKIMKSIVDVAKNQGGDIKASQVEKILTDTLGAKRAKKIQIVDQDAFIKQANKNGALSEKEVADTINSCGGVATADKYAESIKVYINEGAMSPEVKAGTYMHELQHALYGSFSKDSIVPRVFGKFPSGRKYIDKIMEKGKPLELQDKYLKLYDDVYSMVEGDYSIAAKDLLYGQHIIELGEDKISTQVLKVLRRQCKDEARSYALQSKTEEALGHIGLAEYLKVFAEKFTELEKGIGKETKHIRKNRARSFLGLNPNTFKEQLLVAPSKGLSRVEATPRGIQDTYMKLYETLSERGYTLGKFNEGEVKEFLYSQGVLKIGEDKNNARILKKLRNMFKHHANSAADDCIAELDRYTSLINDIKQELKHVRKNRVRSFFGLKPNTAKEQEIVQAARDIGV